MSRQKENRIIPTRIGWLLWISNGEGLSEPLKLVWYLHPDRPEVGDTIELDDLRKVKLTYVNESDLDIKGGIV